jgi:hypothetical protein
MKRWIVGFGLLLSAVGAHAQAVLFTPNAVTFGQVNGTPVLRPQPYASVSVCLITAYTCAPATVYGDINMTKPLAQPFKADNLGNISFWALSGNYEYTVCPLSGACVTNRIGGGNGAATMAATPDTMGSLLLYPGQSSNRLSKVATTGQLGDIVGAVAPSGAGLGMSSDGSVGADNAMTEAFYADFVGCTSSSVPGFDLAANTACSQGLVRPATAGTTMNLVRNVTFSGGDQPSSSQWGMVARVKYVPAGNNLSLGFDATAAKLATTDTTKHIHLLVNASGFGIDNKGTTTTVIPVGGASTGTIGSTDSGFGAGWAAPSGPCIEGAYDVGLLLPGDNTALLSFVQLGSVNCSYSARVPITSLPVCTSPCGSLGTAAGIQNVEIDGSSANDKVTSFAYSDGGPRTVSYDIPHRNGYYNPGVFLRWYINASGATCAPGTTGCTNVWAWVPPAYDRHGQNKWVIAAHGFGETGQMIQNEYNNNGANVSDFLYQQGFVIVSIDNVVQNCYGNPQCVTDVANAVNVVRSALSLAPSPYVMADSMGGEQILNAITHGAIKPKAFVGFCINTSLGWQNDPGLGNQASYVQTAYSFSDPAQYATATAGWDPLLASGSALANLVATPTLLFASTSDTAVNKYANTDAYAALVNAAGGNVTVVTTSGGHLDPSNFPGAKVVNFFNAY